MDIFSLVSPEKNPQENKEENDNDLLEKFTEEDGDGFETPRSAEWTPMSTPRSLFSTPPRSPRTPPRPSSHVDDRIRMRRCKLSTSPSLSPVKSHCFDGGDLLSDPVEDAVPLCPRDTVISFSSAEDHDWNESGYQSSPNDTPNCSPGKNELLSLSPLQQRLARARAKRQQIFHERVQNIDNKSKVKGLQAIKRKEDATLEKVSKARTEESIILAKSKRQQILEERVQKIDVKSKFKEKEASKRKEDVTLEKIEKARSELAKSPIAKERRDQQLALWVENLEASLESKTALAQRRLERHLLEKQRRASCQERKERAERRRKLISYEKRAKLLAGLDAKLERAALKSHKFVKEKAIRAGGDIAKAKGVSRRVRAARVIQGVVREAYGLERRPNRGGSSALCQHDAAGRLQRWSQWRAWVCGRRLIARCNEGDGIPEAALENLLKMFPAVPDGKQPRPLSNSHQPPPFEELGQKMMQPDTLKMATLIVDCLRPVNEVAFGTSSSDPPTSRSSPKIDGRTLLSLSLIAVYPREVLGDDFDRTESSVDARVDRLSKGHKRLARTCQCLISSLKVLLVLTKTVPDKLGNQILNQIASRCFQAHSLLLQAHTLFLWWKGADMEELLGGLQKQLEQSWVIYLTSSETLKYLAELSGVNGVNTVATGSSAEGAKRDDPLMSLRIRHEAGRAGSRSHIKRIRLSLNKLVGAEEGKEFVKNAKKCALNDIQEADVMKDLKGEIDEIYGGLDSIMTSSDMSEENKIASNTSEATKDDQGWHQTSLDEHLAISKDLPDELLSNRVLVHKILLTDPSEFDTLSWDGTNKHSINITPEEFMASFAQKAASHHPNDDAAGSMENMPMRIAQSMRMAFFTQIAQEMSQGNCEPARELLKELHVKMRSLLPSRKDLHSHINDEDISSISSTSDIFRGLIRSGYLLANYLESAARAPTTREIIERVEAFNSCPRHGDNIMVPYGVVSEELFAVASIAYILGKAELCQMDVSNYQLSQFAPVLHIVGNEYERKHFQRTYGDYSSSPIEGLQQMLPFTWNWVKQMHTLFSDSENLTPQSSLEHKMDFVKGKGFVDGVLFTRNQLVLPEILLLDAESINNIRKEARCCVIASALALHACNISKVGTSLLSSSVTTDEVNDARQALSSVLRRQHFEQTELESDTIEAVGSLAKALAERYLAVEELVTLKNHTLAVLRGGDPVIKLLDNRVQSFFRFACKWKSDMSPPGITAPMQMKTGRSVMKTEDNARMIKSTKEEFSLAAKREASRLGFAFCGSDLVGVGNEARNVISLAWTTYGRNILERFLGVMQRWD